MSQRPTPYAAAPFEHPKADIILRSSDNIDFRVFKFLLSLASPFFESLFAIPQPAEPSNQDIKDGLIVVAVTEDSRTLDALLRFCYPCTMAEDPNIEVLKDALDVLEAARKYSIGAIEKKAGQAIINPRILEAEPLRCFAIAHRARLRKETLLAAKSTLTQPLIPQRFKEINLITAADLLSLLAYHQRCGEAVYLLRLNLSWIKYHYTSSATYSWFSGQRCPDSTRCPKQSPPKYMVYGPYSPLWWENFMEETFLALRDRPCKETLQASAEKTVDAVKKQGCNACAPMVTVGMRDFVELFSKKIEKAVSQVTMELDF